MSVMVILLGFSLFVASVFLIAFLWAVRSGQYDDKYTPSIRMLFDDGKDRNAKPKNRQTVPGMKENERKS